MAEVYKARIAQSSGPERILVIKLLPEQGGPDDAVRFIEEAKLALPLTHGNITATFEFDRFEGRPFMVMEYVHGQSLRNIITRLGAVGRQAGVAEAIFVCREVSRALRYAHNYVDVSGRPAPIVHRDVTPENVLVSYSGQVKLTDFGIARSLQALDVSRAWGKPAYVAPEILRGEPGGGESDLYSLACVLYEVLAGWPPLLASTEAETLERVRHMRAEPLSSYREDLPEGLEELVARVLEKDPAQRGLDASAFEVSLSRMLSSVAPHFTEVELSTVVGKLFEQERALEASISGNDSALRLREQLHDVGVQTSGRESAAEILAMGTVALGDEPDPPVPPAPSEPESLEAAITASRALPVDDLERPSAGGALLMTALGLAALIIGGIVAAIMYVDPAGGGGPPRVDSAVVRGDGGPDGAAAHADAAPAPDASEAEQDGDGPTTTRVRPPRRRFGTASFTAYPWAWVYVDGSKVGQTPVRGHKLRAGSHRVRFVYPPLKLTETRRFRVSPNKSQLIQVRFAQE